MLDGDYLGAVRPFDLYDPERIEYIYKTLRHVFAFHQEHGYPKFVINYVFKTPASLIRLKMSSTNLMNPSTYFSLPARCLLPS